MRRRELSAIVNWLYPRLWDLGTGWRNVPGHMLAASGFLLLMLCVAAPAQHWLQGQRAAHREARALLARVMQLPAVPDQSQRAGGDPAVSPLIAVVNQTASTFALAFGDFRPDGDARLALTLQEGDFDALLRWLDALDRQHAIKVVSLDVRVTGTPGRVDAALVVARQLAAREA